MPHGLHFVNLDVLYVELTTVPMNFKFNISTFICLQVRNSAIRTLFQSLGSHGQKLSENIWGTCLWDYVFPILDHASHMVTLM